MIYLIIINLTKSMLIVRMYVYSPIHFTVLFSSLNAFNIIFLKSHNIIIYIPAYLCLKIFYTLILATNRRFAAVMFQ